jgi:hypothetical protein
MANFIRVSPRSLAGAAGAAAAAALVIAAVSVAAQQKDAKEPERRPKLSLKAQPPVAVAPARVVLTAEMTGGANDFEEYYCPTIEWEWGDDTKSESSFDCEPFEVGKSEIRRRFTIEHQFKRSGYYKVYFRLKKAGKAVGAASVNITVRPGPREVVQ